MTRKTSVYRGTSLSMLMMVLIACLSTGCIKGDTEGEDKPEAKKNFIPTKGRKYAYKIEEEDGSSYTFNRWIDAEKDSLSYHVFNLHTELSASGMTMLLDDKIFDAGGKTYTEIKVPDAWYQYIQLIKTMPGVTVQEASLKGYPAFMTMENTVKEGSKLQVSGPEDQVQYIRATQNGKQQEVTQTLTIIPGASVVETIKVPAGTFVCNKYTYNISKQIDTKVSGQSNLSTGIETITIWMAHGTGMVKSVNDGVLLTVVMLPDGPKAIKTVTNSTTTLEKIH